MEHQQGFPAGLAALLLVVSSLSCASRPEEQLKVAQTAMEQAMQEEATDFAPSDWKSAQKAWDGAQAALANQRYSEAATLLTTCRSRFEKAQTISKAKRDDVRKEVRLTQNAVNTNFSALKERISKSRLSGKAQKDFTPSLQDLEAAIEKLDSEVLADHVAQARSSGQAALVKLAEVEKKLDSLTKR